MVFLIMGSVLPGYMFRYQYCLVGGLEAIVFGSIRWCVWSFRPSSPLRLPHLKCLLLLLLFGVDVGGEGGGLWKTREVREGFAGGVNRQLERGGVSTGGKWEGRRGDRVVQAVP